MSVAQSVWGRGTPLVPGVVGTSMTFIRRQADPARGSGRLRVGAALLFVAWLVALPATVQAQMMCAVPGRDGSVTATGTVNTYYAGSGSLSAGATSVVLGTRDTRGSATPVAVGDLVLVIQMQDGTLNSANNANYGSGGGTGQGTTGIGTAGRYEFVRATAVSGSVVSFAPALTHSYTTAAATTTTGQRRYQLVRVPQYASPTLSGVTAPAWDGSSGGVVSVDASGTLTLANATVEGQTGRAVFVAGRGFRGGLGVQANSNGNDAEWRSTANANGSKGEGIAGTPRYVASKTNNFGVSVAAGTLTAVDTGVQGYPNGDYARGAPGNAGGGGTEGTASPGSTTRNAGGGGGGNYAAGGLGGRPWNAPLNDTNGRGGAGYAGAIGFNRVLLGGGGGAGGTNDATTDNNTYENSGIACTGAGARCSSGASGGGVVILRARNFAGTGTIDVRGAHGYNVGNDAAGGGGAGGSVVLHAKEGGSAAIDARGGDGGNAWAGYGSLSTAERHGPGGGGGGGFVAYWPSDFIVSAQLAGGRPGRTTNGVSDTYGSGGNAGGLAALMTPDVPGVSPGADCLPDLRLAKTNNVSTLNNGGSSTYALTVSNSGGPSNGTVTVVDVLPTGLTVANGSVPLSGPQASDWTCTAAGNVLTCASTASVVNGSTSTFAFTAQVVSVVDGSTITNRARVGGGGDELKPVPTATTTGACTGNNTPLGCAVDVDTVNAPLVALTKTDGTQVVVAGGSTTYSMTVSNTGTAPTAGLIQVVDVLPTGMSYTGASPFSSGGFSCSYTAGTSSVACQSTTVIVAGGSTTISLPVAIAGNAPSALTNRAQVGGGGDPGKLILPTVATAGACPAPVSPETTSANPGTGCAADTDSVTAVSLALEKDDGQPFMAVNGQTTYQFRVRNSGAAASFGTIQFRDVLPSPMAWPTPLQLAGTNAADWTCTRINAQVVACTSAVAIAAGAASQFSLVANVGGVTAGQQYTNRARVGAGGDPALPAALDDAAVTTCTGNNAPAGCAIDLNTAQNAAQIRLSKTHADPQTVVPGGTVVFNLVVSNSGGTNSGSNAIRVVDVLPTGITYAGTSSFTSAGFACTHAGGVITCNRSTDLAAGTSVTITFSGTVSASATQGTLTNRAQVGGGGDPQLGAATAVTATTAAECSNTGTPYLGCAVDPVPVEPRADLSITKTSATPQVVAGGSAVFTLLIANAGPSAAHGAAVRDPVASGLACATATCSPAGGAECPTATGAALVSALQSTAGAVLPQLPAGGSVSIALTCTVTASGE